MTGIFEFVGKTYKEIRGSSIDKIFVAPYTTKNQVFGGDIRMTSFLFGETVNEVEVINEVNLDWSKEKVIFLDTEVTFKNRVLSTDFSC